MKVLLVLLSVLALHAQPALIGVQCSGGGNAWSTSTTPMDTTGATLLTLSVTVFNTSAAALAMDDSKGNTWRSLADFTQGTTHGTLWYAYDKAGAPLSVGAGHYGQQNTAAVFSGGCFAAWSGTLADLTDPKDVPALNHNSAAGGSTTTGSITPSVTGELLLSTFGTTAAGTYAIDSAFTMDAQETYGAGGPMGNAIAHLVGTTSAVNPTWSGGGITALGIIQAFKKQAITCFITGPASLPDWNFGSPFSQTIATTGCTTPAFALSPSTCLAGTGLTINSSTGVISGTPTVVVNTKPQMGTTLSCTVQVTDGAGGGNPTQAYTFTLRKTWVYSR